MERLTKQLTSFFGHTAFRKGQLPIIKSILEGRHTFVVMPTGSGKSLCYQLPAVIQAGTAIVVSPLVALMKNQVDALKAKNIATSYLNSTLSRRELTFIKENARQGRLKLLYTSPETLGKETTLELLRQTDISFIAIDEAHCISEWGHDFRPEYQKIQQAAEALGSPPIMALTATATPKVERNILALLKMESATVFRSSFARPNFHYEVRPKHRPQQQLLQFLSRTTDRTGIVYCQTRKKVEEIHKLLQQNHFRAAPYHAGLSTKARNHAQEAFLKKEIDIIVATIAFGMGIDKPDIQFVVHYDAPTSLESYYQETGRAGRDGRKATCIFFYSPDDLAKYQRLNGTKTVSERQNAARRLEEVATYATTPLCRHKQILYYFGEASEKACMQCDNCQNPTARYNVSPLLTTLFQAVQESNETLEEPHLIDLLLGNHQSSYLSTRLHTLSTFAAGKEHHAHHWKSIIHQALLLGYLQKEHYHAPLIKLTPKAIHFLSNPAPCFFHKEVVFPPPESPLSDDRKGIDAQLLCKLKRLRQQEAGKNPIKPYLLFQERTPTAMATHYSTTVDQLATLPHVDPEATEKFGPEFLALIDKHLDADHLLAESDIPSEPTPTKQPKRLQLIKQIDKKIDLKVLAAMHELSYPELIKELADMVHKGTSLRLGYYVDQLIDEEGKAILMEYFEETEEVNIEQACEELHDDFPEDLIRLAHLLHLSQKRNKRPASPLTPLK